MEDKSAGKETKKWKGKLMMIVWKNQSVRLTLGSSIIENVFSVNLWIGVVKLGFIHVLQGSTIGQG